jgi:hypothetical protein
MTSPDSPILTFYRGGRDSNGRSLDQIWAWPDERLEGAHDYIQWLFPLQEPSAFNASAPILTECDIAAFRNDALLAGSLRRSLECMLGFFGLEDTGSEIRMSPSFRTKAARWLVPGNHNHLRLTRILKSLRILGLEHEAMQLFRALEEIYCNTPSRIAPGTFQFWKQAVAGLEQTD